MQSPETRVVYTYPQSSCECACPGGCDPGHLPVHGPRSSLGVKNCDTSAFIHTDSQPFGTNVQPQFNTEGITTLNPGVWDSSARQDFIPVKCEESSTACNTIQYTSPDPRLIDSARSMRLTLDRPPTNDSVPLCQMYTREDLVGYGKNYSDYSDINAGQIKYYVDHSIAAPFHEPVFGTQANVSAYMYQDPMGGLTPNYDRKPFTSPDHLNTKNSNYLGGLSWIQDSTNHREDLLARQLFRQNEQKWASRWAAYGNQGPN